MLLSAFSLPLENFSALLQPDCSPEKQGAVPDEQQQQQQEQHDGEEGQIALAKCFSSPPQRASTTEQLASVTVETSSFSNALLDVGSAWVQGHRSSMEDSHTVELALDSESALLGVYDGHGGAECANFCQQHAADVLRGTPGWAAGDVARALREAFLELDQRMASACPSSSGTTCTIAVLRGPHLAVAGVGDSKCVLFHNKAGVGIDDNIQRASPSSSCNSHGTGNASCDTSMSSGDGGPGTSSSSERSMPRSDEEHPQQPQQQPQQQQQQQQQPPQQQAAPKQHRALSMTVDHRPDMPEEEERIRCAGGFVHQGRINCCLNVSRALGDAQFKQDGFRPASEQQVSPEPDIREAVINTTSDFLLLCSDGIWNSMKVKVVLRFVKQRLQRGYSPADVCRDLCQVCLEPCRTAYDNCTAILVTFKPPSVTQPDTIPEFDWQPRAAGAAQPSASAKQQHEQQQQQQQQREHREQLHDQRVREGVMGSGACPMSVHNSNHGGSSSEEGEGERTGSPSMSPFMDRSPPNGSPPVPVGGSWADGAAAAHYNGANPTGGAAYACHTAAAADAEGDTDAVMRGAAAATEHLELEQQREEQRQQHQHQHQHPNAMQALSVQQQQQQQQQQDGAQGELPGRCSGELVRDGPGQQPALQQRLAN